MIVSSAKDRQELRQLLAPYRAVFLVGCGSCATVCKVGGEEEVHAMRLWLEEIGHQVVGSFILDEACHIMLAARELRRHSAQVNKADAFLVMACGSGAQSLSDSTDKPVLTAVDPLFVGNVRRFGQFEEKCSLCGECILNQTAGICPVTTCAKGLLNGPCGGMEDGHCEVDNSRQCAWVRISERLERTDSEIFSQVVSPKDWSKKIKPGQHQVSRKPGQDKG